MQKNRRFAVLAAAVVGALGSSDLLTPHSARAATHIWEGSGGSTGAPAPGQWTSAAQWNGGKPPWASNDDAYTNRATTEIVFGGSGANSYWSMNDINNDSDQHAVVNILRFNSTASVTNTISNNFPGGIPGFNSDLTFVFNGTTVPRITQDSGGAFDVDMPLNFNPGTGVTSVQFTGGGTGRVTLLQQITGASTLDIQGGNTWISGNAQLLTQTAINFGNAGGGGSLTLDHSRGGVMDRLIDSAPITFGVGGGTLAFVGAASGSSETVGNITVSAGANRLSATSTGGSATLQTGTFNRTGGVVDFASSGGTLGTSATSPRILWANTPSLVNGIIGGWATVNGVDFASYGPNGVTAYAGGYTPLPPSNFDANTNYEAAGNVTLTGGGNIFTVRLNAAANQTIDLGANNVTVTGGILKIGAGTTTINGTGNLAGGSGELVLHVNQGALTFNAPFASTKWTKAGAGGLNLTLASSPVWQTASFSGPVTLNVTADSTVSGQLAGAGSLIKNGPGKLTLTNSANGFSGGGTINGGTVELLAQTNATSISIASQSSYFGSGGNLNINGGTLKLTTRTGGNITVGRNVIFGANGGVLDMTNTTGGFLSAGNIPLTANNTGTNLAVIKWNGGDRGFAANNTQETWDAAQSLIRFSSLNGTGPIRVELTNAGAARQGNGGGGTQNIAQAFTFAGNTIASGGDSGSGPNALNDPSRTKTTGRIYTDNANVLNYQNGVNFEGALQMAVQGAARAIQGNITLSGVASGNPAFVTFSGRGTGTAVGPTIQQPGGTGVGQNPLWLNYNGTGAAGTLRIQEGAIASMDLRVRTEQNNNNGVFMEGATVIENGGTLRFTQSWSGGTTNTAQVVGFDRVNNTITGQGATTKESSVDLYLPAADTVNVLRLNGVQFTNNVALVVNGTGLGGLRVNGLNRPANVVNGTGMTDVAGDVKIANLLTQSRLVGLTGTGGFLTPAAQGVTYTLPSASEWAASVPVGLRATTSNANGIDVALPAGSTWAHNLHVDAGAELGVNGVTVNNGTTPTVVSGLGTLNSGAGVNFSSGVTVAPGAAGVAGTLSVTGAATLAAGATLKAELTGATYGALASTDNLNVTGSTLSVVPTNVTGGAHRYIVAQADTDANAVGTIVGKFATPTLPADEAGQLGRKWSLVYEPTRVSVGFTIGGDTDYSGLVNFADLLSLARHYNATDAQWIDGDFDRNGLVNFADLLTLARNYNAATPGALPGATAEFNGDMAAAFAQAAVPEPGTLGLIGIGAMGLIGGRRRRRA